MVAAMSVAALQTADIRNTPPPKEHAMSIVTRATPILHVNEVEPSVRFWTERLGFEKTIEVPEGNKIGFAAVASGGVELMYQTYSGMHADPTNPLAEAADQGPTFVFMEVADIKRVIAAMKGADIIVPLHHSSYGAQELIVREPGEHFIIFSQLPAH
jgi:uncharacterized glyoxalase superfamily protein PhnB